jgi:Planctomycete cytochrome C
MWRYAGLLMFAFVAGCGDEPAPPPTLTEIETDIFAKSCAFSTCHKGASPAGGVLLDGPTYDHLVNKESVNVPGKILVVPGDPAASYLYEKLTQAKPASGTQMPPAAPLSDARLEMIEAWISAGAKND